MRTDVVERDRLFKVCHGSDTIFGDHHVVAEEKGVMSRGSNTDICEYAHEHDCADFLGRAAQDPSQFDKSPNI